MVPKEDVPSPSGKRVAGWLYLLPKIMSFLVGGGREKEREAGSSNIRVIISGEVIEIWSLRV